MAPHPERIEPVNASHIHSLIALFERNTVNCYCQWWAFEGDKNEWLERCAHFPNLNRDAFAEQIAGTGPQGIVALCGELAIGWLKLTRADALSKLYNQRFYRNLPCFGRDQHNTLTIACLFVDEAWRRRGVARRLLASASTLAEELDVQHIEAFPRQGQSLGAAEMWMGPIQLFLQAGFVAVQEHTAYPVLRRSL